MISLAYAFFLRDIILADRKKFFCTPLSISRSHILIITMGLDTFFSTRLLTRCVEVGNNIIKKEKKDQENDFDDFFAARITRVFPLPLTQHVGVDAL